MRKHIFVVYGTRPESLKLAGPVREMRRLGLPVFVWSLNQSPDLLDDTVLKPDYVGDKVSLSFSLRMNRGSWDSQNQERPPASLVVIQGDTASCLDAALAAFNAGVPVYHIEAGVRSGDLSSPFPEEGYRRMISQIATYHACTTEHNHNNLWLESYRDWKFPDHDPIGDKARVTGSPIVESVRERQLWETYEPDNDILLTLHRRENRGHFGDILAGVADTMMRVIWPAHPNGWAVEENGTRLTPVHPLSAEHFAGIMRGVAVVVTDSGGVQEECQTLGVPCVVARTVTDRPESLISEPGGGCVLGGNTREGIREAIEQALQIDRSTIHRDVYGDGTASVKIAQWLKEIVGC